MKQNLVHGQEERFQLIPILKPTLIQPFRKGLAFFRFHFFRQPLAFGAWNNATFATIH
jgi:hypothetical protein